MITQRGRVGHSGDDEMITQRGGVGHSGDDGMITQRGGVGRQMRSSSQVAFYAAQLPFLILSFQRLFS